LRLRFILNGLENANHILNEQIFDTDDWKVIGEYVYDSEGGRHQAFYSPKRDVNCAGVLIREGELVKVEDSLKYSEEESKALWDQADLKEVGRWLASKESYSKLQFLYINVFRIAMHSSISLFSHVNTASLVFELWMTL
jgi:L-histidine Nalpha-methyltransferase / hercynylcysteine S-oxide synthase